MATGYMFSTPGDVVVAMRTFESALRFIEEAVDSYRGHTPESEAVATLRRELDAKSGACLSRLLRYSSHEPSSFGQFHEKLLDWFLGVYADQAMRTGAARWPVQCECGGALVSELSLKEIPESYWRLPAVVENSLNENDFDLNDLIGYQESVQQQLLQRTTLLSVLSTCMASLDGVQTYKHFEEAVHTLRVSFLQRIVDVKHRLLQLKVLALEASGPGVEALKEQVRRELGAVNCMVLLDSTGSTYQYGYRTDTANRLRAVLGLAVED